LRNDPDNFNYFEILYDHSKCTEKHKACARCKKLLQRKIEIHKPVIDKTVEKFLSVDNNIDHEFRGRKIKPGYIVHNSTLYFKDSCYQPLKDLKEI
jgi:hypothetical protein